MGSVTAAHACHEAVECIPVIQKLVAHAKKRELLKAAACCTSPDSALVHAVKRILVIPAKKTHAIRKILRKILFLLQLKAQVSAPKSYLLMDEHSTTGESPQGTTQSGVHTSGERFRR